MVFTFTSLIQLARFVNFLTLSALLSVSLLFSSTLLAEEKTLLVLGDSLSAAHGIPLQSGWVQLLAENLSQQPRPYHVANASISGETTGGGLARLPSLLQQYQPAIVIIELGANDGLRGFPISTIRSNLSSLITLSQRANARVLLTGMHIPPNYGSRYTQLFYNNYVQLAQQHQTWLVPFLLEGIASQPALMQADGLHPVAAAQPRILENVMPYLNKLL